MKIDISEEAVKIIETFSGKTIKEFLDDAKNSIINEYVAGGRITVKDASEIMGVSQQFIRIGLQQGILPFGVAVRNSSQYTYYISPKKFYEYTGYYNK